MQRRVLGGLVALVGATFLVIVAGNGLFGASSSWETLSDDVRPAYTDAQIAQLRADAARLRAVSTEFGSDVLPTLARALGVTEAQLATRFAGDFPATATGVLAMPAIAGALEERANLLEAQQENFRSADAIPTVANSSTAVPWFITITGILAIAVGIAMLVARGAVAPVLAGVLGAVMLVVPLVTSLPSKGAAADDLSAATGTLYAQESVAASRQAIATIQAMGGELQAGLIPGLARQLQITPAQAQAFVQESFPAIAAALTELPAALQRLGAATDLVAASADEFADVADVPNRAIAWSVVAGGVAVMVLSSIAAATSEVAAARQVARRRRRDRLAA